MTSRPRRALAGFALLALATASALVTTKLATSTARPTSVASADDSPVLLPGSLPPNGPAPTSPVATATRNTCVNVPIIYYHYIRSYNNPHDKLGEQLSVAPSAFQAQMDWMRVAGVHPVTLAQVMAAVTGGLPLPSHPVVLTFDDGHNDFATRAVPILMREGFVATAFVVPGFLGQPSYMTDQQVVQVAQDGMVIGAHTMHHVDLNADSEQLARIEIDASRTVLQQLTGQPVNDFAYPYGDYDSTVVSLVAEDGFRDAVATTWGTQQCVTNRFTLHRIEAAGSYSVSALMRATGLPLPSPGWTDPGLPPVSSRSS